MPFIRNIKFMLTFGDCIGRLSLRHVHNKLFRTVKYRNIKVKVLNDQSFVIDSRVNDIESTQKNNILYVQEVVTRFI